MKKQLTTLFLVVAALLMPFALTSCGEDVQLNENGGNNGKPKTGTKFSSGGSGTRTTIDDAGLFYWQAADKIWVDETGNGDFALMSDQITLGADHRTADFFFNGKDLTNKTYNLIYTGSNATAGSQKTVTIASAQKQKGFDNAEHIGTSGDCASATATQDAIGDYTFTLDHKAHYLVLQPYKAAAVTDDWKLVSIEITDYDGNALCGTYDFSMSGLSNPTSTGSTVTVELVNDAGTSAPESLPTSATRSVYAVISPDDLNNRNLRIRYTVKRPSGGVWGRSDGVFSVTKDISFRPYNTNGVTKIQHELSVLLYTTTYYMWDAPVNTPYSYGTATYNSAAVAPTLASRSCAGMPNANEMSWYIANGNPHWDDTQYWSNTNGTWLYTGGIWLMKKDAIIAAGKTFDSTIGATGGNMLINAYPYENINVSSGRPKNIDNYFFLPAAGFYYYVNGSNSDILTSGRYWTSSPFPNNNMGAWTISFTSTAIGMSSNNRDNGILAGDYFK